MSSNSGPKRRAIVLDLDGTLVDSAQDLALALNQTLTSNGRETVDLTAVKRMIGDGIAKLVERGFEATGGVPAPSKLERAIADCLHCYESNTSVQSRVFDEVPEILPRLRDEGYRLAVCTNKPHGAAVHLMQDLEIAHYFDCVTGGDSLPSRKPDPEVLLHTLKVLDTEPSAALMVGDHLNDARAAAAAGVPFFFAAYGYGRREDIVEPIAATLSEFGDLPKAMSTLKLDH